MDTLTSKLTVVAVALTLVGCEAQQAETPGHTETLSRENTSGLILTFPVTTQSDAARGHFLQGLRALDMSRFIDANKHFTLAVQADPSFAYAHLSKANSSNSLEEFKSALDLAAENAAHASEPERLLIKITQRGFASDVEGQLELASELVHSNEDSPRAWLTLAGVQTTLANHDEARTAMMKAIELEPRMTPAYIQLGTSYLFNEPRDFAKSEEYMVKAVELDPNEPNTHDFLGDAYRASGQLEKARDAYTRAAELAPHNALPPQQRGHVNSFLGAYDAARADYDAAIALGRANEKASYAVYRAFVSVHAGEPDLALEELAELVEAMDGMGIVDPTGLKIFALTNAATIAMHHDKLDTAEELLDRRAVLMRQQVAQVATDEFERGQKANIAYYDGLLAARRGEFASAEEKAARYAELVEPDANPRKMEPVHEMKGLISLLQEDFAEAVRHYEQGNLTTLYTQYLLARSHEGAGNTDEAKELYAKIADYNFNSVGFALVREEAMAKR